MGKQGPCSHCGATTTPLWRNGPPEKPVLCNACGSRWRTKGSLVNYTPLHARSEPSNLDYSKLWKAKATADFKHKEAKVLKRKPHTIDAAAAAASEISNQEGFSSKVFDEDTGNGSSSASATSNSESSVHDGNADVSEWTGPLQPVSWDSAVPSRKRTCVARGKPSPVEKLTKDLYTIWQEQQQSSCLSGFSEEEVLLETDRPMVSVEFGHGSVLIKHPSSVAHEEESVASSISFETKQDTVSLIQTMVAAPVAYAGVDSSSEEIKKLRRDKDQLGETQILNHHNTQLRNMYSQDFENRSVTESKTSVAGLIGFGTSHLVNIKSPQRKPLHKHAGKNGVARNPRGSSTSLPRDKKEFAVKNGDFSSSAHVFFPSQDENGCSVMEDSNSAADFSDQDLLLLDVPSNGSFPLAELLLLPSSRIQ